MNNNEREQFWKVLKNAHDNSETTLEELNKVYMLPNRICRFRTVNENSLLQLQNNQLFFSSADYYDDPFDTYFYIDYKALNQAGDNLHMVLNGDPLVAQKHMSKINPDFGTQDMIDSLKGIMFKAENLRSDFQDIRSQIQRQLYSICFCENPKNETLWLKYAANHKGFVMIYDPLCQDTFRCGKDQKCVQCPMEKPHPNIYPVYYTDTKYDGTKFALGVLCQNMFTMEQKSILPPIFKQIVQKLDWESERISLIKKKCHEYDEEWRMIYPYHLPSRPCIKMKPISIALGLRMPEYERKLVISAAQLAGISEINEMYINDEDELDMRRV